MEFTITETFSYFGRLLGLKTAVVRARQEELLALLDLPTKEQEVRQGGKEARRQGQTDVYISARCGP